MPFRAARRHQYWTADVRYIDDHRLGEGTIYVISILENHSRAVLTSSLSRSQDLGAFLRVLHRAVEEYGSPEALVTDGDGIFRAKRVKPSTRHWASARRRSSGAGPGNPT